LILPDKHTKSKQGEQQIVIKGPTEAAIIDVKSRLEILMETVRVYLVFVGFLSSFFFDFEFLTTRPPSQCRSPIFSHFH
jgi:hypothetical protein